MSIPYHEMSVFYHVPQPLHRADGRATLSPMRSATGMCLVLALCACGESSRDQSSERLGGTLVISTTADPGTLFPPLTYTTQGKQITEQLYDYLADVGPAMNTRGDEGFRGQLAKRWEWSRDSLSIAFVLDPNARWHDGKPVTARDVVFTFALNKNPALGGDALTALGNIDSVSARDSLTAVFWFHARSPTQFLDAAAQTLVLPEHQLDTVPVAKLREAALPPIGSGRFRFRRWQKGSSVEIVADSANYRGRARLDRVIWTIAPDYTTALTRFLGGVADLFDALRAEDLDQVVRHPNLRVITLPGTDYNFLQFNLRDPVHSNRPHPLFGDRSLRRAIAMSIDRNALVRSVLDTLGFVALGPTVRAFPTTDPAIPQIPFDRTRAAALLDSLGWVRTDSSAVRARNGRQLAFNVLVPSSSRNRVRMAVLLQAQLARVGVRTVIETMESQAMVRREESGNFDAALGGWHLGASPDGTRQAWTAAGLGGNGVNYGSYVNHIFDIKLDSALQADPAHARGLFTDAYRTINEDAPAVWLYEPKTVLGIDRRFRTAAVRPDAWWLGLAEWYVPAAELSARDRTVRKR
jgi:peptide/nickel transport system substrate-binding protein